MNEPASFHINLDEIARSIGKLPSWPAVALELLQSIDDENANAEALARKIAKDQALVAKLLRMANSSFYGLQSQVDSIQDAVVVLGLRSTRMLALSAAFTSSSGRTLAAGFDFRNFWRHSLATALCARALARQLKAHEENAFAAGLLHDIGRLVLASCFPRSLEAVLQHRAQLDCHLIDAERTVLGMDHAQIGKVAAERWRFPAPLRDAIAGHHSVEQKDRHSLAYIVQVADAVVHALDLAGDATEMVPRISSPCWNAIRLSWDDAQALFEACDSQFEDMSQLLLG